MGAQFGRWHFGGRPIAPGHFEKANELIRPYGPDGGSFYSNVGVDILHSTLCTTKESHHENQPYATESGAVICWDGRLDNRSELFHKLRGGLSSSSTDTSIVAAAYETWRTNGLGTLIGDWALSVWDPHSRALLLAKDVIGTRPLFYCIDQDQVTWSTILDPLVLLTGRPLDFDREYVAGWLSYFPATHLTPYIGIRSVPPASVVLIRPGIHSVQKYWDFDPGRHIHYRSDADYEEHFRTVFAESVRRRLRSDLPVMAELSGGVDSSSIVCMADSLLARGLADTPWLDTLSYFDETEPNWNERPYFERVEAKRGVIGCHVDVSAHEEFFFESDGFSASPGANLRSSRRSKAVAECLISHGNRVVLSGTGGDEVLGGVPTPTPELADLFAEARLRSLARQLKVWAFEKRKPWLHLLLEMIRQFLPPTLGSARRERQPASWLHPAFLKRYWTALTGYPRRLRMFGPRPSFQENLATLDGLRRQLGCTPPPRDPAYDRAYPYLDRELLEFVYAIPREQLLRPGHRRSLMRRAMAGIVPDEILNRRRKAFIARGPTVAIARQSARLVEICQNMIASSLQIVDSRLFQEAIELTRNSKEVPLIAFDRTLILELWLRDSAKRGLLDTVACLHSRVPERPTASNRVQLSLPDHQC